MEFDIEILSKHKFYNKDDHQAIVKEIREEEWTTIEEIIKSIENQVSVNKALLKTLNLLDNWTYNHIKYALIHLQLDLKIAKEANSHHQNSKLQRKDFGQLLSISDEMKRDESIDDVPPEPIKSITIEIKDEFIQKGYLPKIHLTHPEYLEHFSSLIREYKKPRASFTFKRFTQYLIAIPRFKIDDQTDLKKTNHIKESVKTNIINTYQMLEELLSSKVQKKAHHHELISYLYWFYGFRDETPDEKGEEGSKKYVRYIQDTINYFEEQRNKNKGTNS